MESNTSLNQLHLSSTVNSVLNEETFYLITSVGTVFLTLLCIIGCSANAFNMAVFAKMGLQESINISLFGLSFADLFNNITSISYAVFYNQWAIEWFGIPVSLLQAGLPLLVYPHLFFINISILITSYVAFERCICVAMPIKVKLLFTPTRSKQVIIVAFLLNTLTTALLFICYRFDWTHDFLTITNVKERVDIFNGVIYFQVTFNFAGPYIFVGICASVLLTKLKTKSNWRKDATKSSSATKTKSSDQDIKAVKMVVSVLIMFIVCTLPGLILKFTLVAIGKDLRATGPLYRLSIVIHMIVFIFDGINATCNIFIYFHSSSRYRATCQKMYLPYTKK